MDILESTDVQDPQDNTKKERWLRVKARDEDATEGWIEARNVMPEDVHEESRKLAEEDKEIPAQASGQGNRVHPDGPYQGVPGGGRFKDAASNMMCQQPPWGQLTAVDVNTGEFAWRVPLGITESLPRQRQTALQDSQPCLRKRSIKRLPQRRG